MSDTPHTDLLLGQIKGLVESLVEGQKAQAHRFDKLDARIDTIDVRVRSVEVRAATFSAVTGGVMGIGMALLVESIKDWMRRGPPAP